MIGDMDLNPVTGQYRLSATVPEVELNEVRKTLGIKPPPLPVGGAIRGVLHVTGPLEQPVFSGIFQIPNLSNLPPGFMHQVCMMKERYHIDAAKEAINAFCTVSIHRL